MARSDASKILEPSKAARDDIESLVGLPGVADLLLAVEFTGNDDPYFPPLEPGAKRIGVLTLVRFIGLDPEQAHQRIESKRG